MCMMASPTEEEVEEKPFEFSKWNLKEYGGQDYFDNLKVKKPADKNSKNPKGNQNETSYGQGNNKDQGAFLNITN